MENSSKVIKGILIFYKLFICSLYNDNRSLQFSINLRDNFNNPKFFKKVEYLDPLIRGLATQPSAKIDLVFDEDVSLSPISFLVFYAIILTDRLPTIYFQMEFMDMMFLV